MKPQVLRCRFFLVACLSLPIVARGQQGRLDSPDKVESAIAEVESGKFALVTVERVAEAHAVEAIPVLKEQFALSKDDLKKGKIAAALVRLGDKDNTYWDYLVAGANAALDSDLPFVSTSKENPIPPEFVTWSQTHGVSLEEAVQDAMLFPVKVGLLAETRDTRAIPVLRRALQSRNTIMVMWGAKGLAAIQDKNSIPLIIDACRRSPEDAPLIAESLIFFDDPLAQREADTLLSQDVAKALREGRAKGATPFY